MGKASSLRGHEVVCYSFSPYISTKQEGGEPAFRVSDYKEVASMAHSQLLNFLTPVVIPNPLILGH